LEQDSFRHMRGEAKSLQKMKGIDAMGFARGIQPKGMNFGKWSFRNGGAEQRLDRGRQEISPYGIIGKKRQIGKKPPTRSRSANGEAEGPCSRGKRNACKDVRHSQIASIAKNPPCNHQIRGEWGEIKNILEVPSHAKKVPGQRFEKL